MWDPFMILRRGLAFRVWRLAFPSSVFVRTQVTLNIVGVQFLVDLKVSIEWQNLADFFGLRAGARNERTAAERQTPSAKRQAPNAYSSLPRAASDMIFSSVASRRSNSPVNFPRRITRTRSARASTSGRSLEMTRIAMPSWASWSRSE